MGFQELGLPSFRGFRVQGLRVYRVCRFFWRLSSLLIGFTGLRVSGLWGVGFGVYRIYGLGFRVQGLKAQALGCRAQLHYNRNAMIERIDKRQMS